MDTIGPVRKEVLRRSVLPAAIAVAGTILFQVTYNRSIHIANPLLNDITLWGGFIGMVVCTFLSAPVVYAISFSGEAGTAERIIAALAAPLVKSFLILSSFFGIFSFGEVLLLLLHHVVLAPLVFAFFEIGITSLICHTTRRKKEGKQVRIMWRAESIFLLLGLGLFTLFFWQLGHWYYYRFLDMYIRIFGSGGA